MNKTPDEILLHHAEQYLKQGCTSQAKFVHEDLLPSLIKAGIEKQEDHKTADEYEKWHSAKVRQINSILNRKTNMPMSWMWCWLDALPAPYGTEARAELLAQGGVMAVTLPRRRAMQKRADLPQLFREVSDVMEAGAVVAADGKYDAGDDPGQLVTLASELTDVVQHCVGEMLAVAEAVDLSGTRAYPIVQMCKATK